jgi:hypothetical protein
MCIEQIRLKFSFTGFPLFLSQIEFSDIANERRGFHNGVCGVKMRGETHSCISPRAFKVTGCTVTVKITKAGSGMYVCIGNDRSMCCLYLCLKYPNASHRISTFLPPYLIYIYIFRCAIHVMPYMECTSDSTSGGGETCLKLPPGQTRTCNLPRNSSLWELTEIIPICPSESYGECLLPTSSQLFPENHRYVCAIALSNPIS